MATVYYYDLKTTQIEQECYMDADECCVPIDIFVPPATHASFTGDVAVIRRGIHSHWFPSDAYHVYINPQEACLGQSAENFGQDGPPMLVRTKNYQGLGISGVLLGRRDATSKIVYPTVIRYHGGFYQYEEESISGPIYFKTSRSDGPQRIYGRPYVPAIGEYIGHFDPCLQNDKSVLTRI